FLLFFFSSRRRHTRFSRDWSSDVCSSDLAALLTLERTRGDARLAASLAEATQRREALLELRAGPRGEDIDQARASLAAARAQARSEERRGGNGWRARGWTEQERKQNEARC